MFTRVQAIDGRSVWAGKVRVVLINFAQATKMCNHLANIPWSIKDRALSELVTDNLVSRILWPNFSSTASRAVNFDNTVIPNGPNDRPHSVPSGLRNLRKNATEYGECNDVGVLIMIRPTTCSPNNLYNRCNKLVS